MIAAALALALCGSARAEPAPRPLTLPEAYRLALRRSEDLARRGEGVAELEARTRELWSFMLPRLALTGSELIQDVPPTSSGASAVFNQRTRESAQFTLHQPIFAGLRELLAIKAAGGRTRAAEHALRRASQLLYQDTAAAYLDLLALRRELSIRRGQGAVTDDRIKELKDRERLGRSRRSEVLAAQSQRAQIEAQIAAASGRERAAQEVLRFLTGLEEDFEPAPVPLPEDLGAEPYLRGASRRPDVSAAVEEAAAARYGIDIAGRQRWPTLSLDGNYYLHRPPGFQDKVRWDLTFGAQLPLYAGGQTSAQILQAEAQHRSARDAASLALRRAQLEVRSAHSALRSGLAVAAALESAEGLAQANAAAQAEDYRLGMVTNLDVLGALNALQETRLSLERARLDAVEAGTRLEVAAGLPGGAP